MAPISRRKMLGYTGATAGVIGVGGIAASCSTDDDSSAGSASTSGTIFAFRGEHQAGVASPQSASGIVLALDLRVDTREELRETFIELSDSIEKVMSGEAYESRDGGFPAYDSGILGAEPGATSTAVVVAYGNDLFDDRFGLADRKPVELQRMPHFDNDFMVTEERSHGDLLLTVTADSNEASQHAIRQILRETRGKFVPRWTQDGFANLIPDAGPGEAPMRNLMGFKDGTANLDHNDDAALNDLVWIQDGDGQPDWALGGTYQAVRVIRMQNEFWDRTRLNEQEAIFGRHRASGAPLGGAHETDTPVFVDLESHIARANPRTPGSERSLMLRKGFNYAKGFDQNDQLDQGLIFISFQRSLVEGFIAVQNRLNGEVLEEYVRPQGGGLYFAPPAPAIGEFLGERLLA
ncbi:MAG: Dyp-type peroxidase [Actinomycetota bacterium]